MLEIKNKYTRAVQREFKRLMFVNSKVWSEWLEQKIELDPNSLENANDYLVKTLYWLTDEELDQLSSIEFDKMLAEAGKAWSPLLNE